MQRVKTFYNKHFLFCTILIVIGLICLINFRYFTYFINGKTLLADDILYHINRIQGVADSIDGGVFPAILHPNTLNGYGYANSIFYQEYFLYIPAFLVSLGMNVTVAYMLFILLIVISMCLIFYTFVKKFTINKYIITISIIVFILTQYIFLDLFYRGALGEVLGALFFEVVMLGLYNMLKEDFSKPWLLLIGFCGIALSHTVTLVITAFFLIVVVLINAKKLLTEKSFYLKILSIAPIFILVLLMFYFPMLEMYLSDDFWVNNSWIKTSETAQNLYEIVIDRYGLGIITVIILLLRAFIKTNDENRSRMKLIDKGLIFIAIITFIVSALFPWKQLDNVVSLIQFPWRLYLLTICILPLVEVGIIYEFCKSKQLNIKKAFTILIVLLSIYNCTYLNHYASYDFTYNQIAYGEWLPVNSLGLTRGEQKEIYLSNNYLIDNDGNIVEYYRKDNSVHIEFLNEIGDESYTIPLIYYKGYTAKLIDVDGNEYELNITRDEVARVIVQDIDVAGTVIIDYHTSNIQILSYMIGLGAVGLSIAFVPLYIHIFKRSKQQSNKYCDIFE